MTRRSSRRSRDASNLTAPLKRRRSDESSPPPAFSHSRSKVKAELSADAASSATPDGLDLGPEQDVDEEFLCPICHLLLYRPVITKCKHTLCESCMAHWADVSASSQMTIVSLDEQPDSVSISDVEAKCAMCRTQTSTSLDSELAEQLRARYPKTYKERREEEEAGRDDGSEAPVQTMTLYIGNTHQFSQPEGEPVNMHDWTFFVKPSRTDIVEEVHILLHPTFNPSRIVRQRAPYEIRRRGWGYFTIVAYVVLKAGYSWVSGDAEDTPDGASKGSLPLEWGLDFSRDDGQGSMGRCSLKVKNDRGWEVEDDQIGEDQRSWQRNVAEYARDGRWEPEDD